MSKKYRKLNNEEMKELKGKWIKEDLKNDADEYLVIGCSKDDGQILILIDNDWVDSKDLLDNYVYLDGSTIGIKEELSSDGYTLEEFTNLIDKDFSNVEELVGISQDNELVYNCLFSSGEFTYNSLIAKIKNNLSKFRIKPKPKYLRPKNGFRGSVFGEVYGNFSKKWIKMQCVATTITVNRKIIYLGIDAVNYHNFRTPIFSKDNHPAINTRFRCDSGVCDYNLIRYVKDVKDGLVRDSFDRSYSFENVEWIDFEEFTL